MGNYIRFVNTDINLLWDKFDIDKNGALDKQECSKFIDTLKNHMVPLRAQNYQKDEFEQMFKKYDDDKNGFLEKCELANFIKQAFKSRQFNTDLISPSPNKDIPTALKQSFIPQI